MTVTQVLQKARLHSAKLGAWRMECKSVNGGTRRQASREGPVLVVKLRAGPRMTAPSDPCDGR